MAMKIKTEKEKIAELKNRLENDYTRIYQLTLAAKNGVFNY